ncbi:Mitochondrial ATPase complex subunit atp10 [Borealophlyctis nickersoniae]|nr:Mitochondrial ATPase complex subunit atp10 [Borealophlyctis nickersoniae]
MEKWAKSSNAPNVLLRMEQRLQEQRKTLEAAQLEKRAKGEYSKVSPEMQKKMDEFMDADANERRMRQLFHEAFKEGYFNDAKEVAKKGVKLWEAPKKLRLQSLSPTMPNVAGRTLAKEDTDLMTLMAGNNVTLVTFALSALGESQVASFIEPFLKEFKDVKGVGMVQLAVEENWIKGAVMRLLVPWTRLKTPRERRANYLLHFNSIREERRAAGMTNGLLGWVNLVDSTGRIRWQANGPAADHEIASLLKFTKDLNVAPPAKPPTTLPNRGTAAKAVRS